MNNVRTFIPKDDYDLPDFYTIEINYITGKQETFNITSHCYIVGNIEFVTHEDLWYVRPLSNIIGINFDKNFSKIVAIKQKNKSKEAKN